jgi:hypothetical protein
VFIDSEGASYWQFKPPILTQKNEFLQATLTLPPELTSRISLATRQNDGSFNTQEAISTINEIDQATPFAYQVYASYKPPLARQLALLSLIAACLILIKPKHAAAQTILQVIVAGVLTAGYLSPQFEQFPWVLLIIQSSVLLAGFWYLTGRGFHISSAVAGAALFAYTTWWPLQFAAGRSWYFIIALVALLVVAISKQQPHPRRVWAVILLLICAAVIIPQGFSWQGTQDISCTASLRNMLLDPYQLPFAQKQICGEQAPLWHNFGAYIGIPAALAALIDIVTSARKNRWTLVAFIIIALPFGWHMPSMFATAISHSSIVLVALLAYFVATGIEKLRQFLGIHDVIVRILTGVIALIIVLDLWYVTTDVLEHLYG